ncbi:hypothetical protein [Scytonema sp. HK-05]|nr:hypothetical protein [Scytonema sp. HK-05]
MQRAYYLMAATTRIKVMAQSARRMAIAFKQEGNVLISTLISGVYL